MVAILASVKWYLIVVFMCISQWLVMLSIFLFVSGERSHFKMEPELNLLRVCWRRLDPLLLNTSTYFLGLDMLLSNQINNWNQDLEHLHNFKKRYTWNRMWMKHRCSLLLVNSCTLTSSKLSAQPCCIELGGCRLVLNLVNLPWWCSPRCLWFSAAIGSNWLNRGSHVLVGLFPPVSSTLQRWLCAHHPSCGHFCCWDKERLWDRPIQGPEFCHHLCPTISFDPVTYFQVL